MVTAQWKRAPVLYRLFFFLLREKQRDFVLILSLLQIGDYLDVAVFRDKKI